ADSPFSYRWARPTRSAAGAAARGDPAVWDAMAAEPSPDNTAASNIAYFNRRIEAAIEAGDARKIKPAIDLSMPETSERPRAGPANSGCRRDARATGRGSPTARIFPLAPSAPHRGAIPANR